MKKEKKRWHIFRVIIEGIVLMALVYAMIWLGCALS